MEGSRVIFRINDGKLVLVPVDDGQSSVKDSIGVCGTSGSGSSPDSGPAENRGDEKWKVKRFIKKPEDRRPSSQYEINEALERLNRREITLVQYQRIVDMYKPRQDWLKW